MAKPILVIDISHNGIKYINEITKIIQKATNNEYHVIVRGVDNSSSTIQCFNDCKGLPDIDIEKMINELMEKH